MLEISGALSSARALVDMAKVALDARDDAKVKAALSDLQMRLYDATSAALLAQEQRTVLAQEIDALRRELQELRSTLEDRNRYALTEICAGAYVYASQPAGEGSDKRLHYVCQPCFDAGTKAVLRYSPPRTGLNGYWDCPERKEHRIVNHGTAMPLEVHTVRSANRWSDY